VTDLFFRVRSTEFREAPESHARLNSIVDAPFTGLLFFQPEEVRLLKSVILEDGIMLFNVNEKHLVTDWKEGSRKELKLENSEFARHTIWHLESGWHQS
jgi:hypothetical protein